MTGKRLAVKTPMDSNNHEQFHKAEAAELARSSRLYGGRAIHKSLQTGAIIRGARRGDISHSLKKNLALTLERSRLGSIDQQV